MMSNVTNSVTHADIELLLPWYINGTLGRGDVARVESHLQACADCRDAVSINRQMQDSVQQDGPVPILPATTAAQIIDGAPKSTTSSVRRPQWQRWAVAATTGLIAMLMLWSLNPVSTTQNSNQQFAAATASGNLANIDYVLELRFAAGVSRADRQAIIKDLGGNTATMDATETLFRIVVRLPPKSLQELQQYAAGIQSRPELETAEIVALQLPLR